MTKPAKKKKRKGFGKKNIVNEKCNDLEKTQRKWPVTAVNHQKTGPCPARILELRDKVKRWTTSINRQINQVTLTVNTQDLGRE